MKYLKYEKAHRLINSFILFNEFFFLYSHTHVELFDLYLRLVFFGKK